MTRVQNVHTNWNVNIKWSRAYCCDGIFSAAVAFTTVSLALTCAEFSSARDSLLIASVN